LTATVRASIYPHCVKFLVACRLRNIVSYHDASGSGRECQHV